VTPPDDETPTRPASPLAAAAVAPPAPVPPGLRRIGDHDVTGVLGRGGFGVVYRAVHAPSGEPRAIKVLAAELAGDAEMLKRFAREARVVALVDHPSIVRTLDVGQLPDGRPYFVMELVEAVGLHQLIRERGRLSGAEAAALLAPVCAALEAAHAAGVVHRDLKAANVLVARDGEGWRVKLADFGIAKLLDPAPGTTALTVGGQRIGTPEAMAPEQIAGGEIDRRTDVYALGILLFHLLTGRYPFHHADPGEVERMHLAQPVPSVGDAALDGVLARATAKQPAKRTASAAAFLAELQAFAGTPSGVAGAGPAPSAGAADATPTRRSAGDPIGVVIIVPRAGTRLDVAGVARVAEGAEVRSSALAGGAIVCLVSGGDASAVARRTARDALALAKTSGVERVVARLAARATELHVAYNTALDATAPPRSDWIDIDADLAARLAGAFRVERSGARHFLVAARGSSA
jgi:hypothetical protein